MIVSLNVDWNGKGGVGRKMYLQILRRSSQYEIKMGGFESRKILTLRLLRVLLTKRWDFAKPS